MKKETWNDYQNKYRKNHYSQLSASLEPQLVKEFKEKLKKDKISFPTFLRTRIEEYLGEK